MTAFAPATESRIRELQAGRADRDAKRSEDAAKQSERERKSQEAIEADQVEKRQGISPNEHEAQQRHKAAIEYYAKLHEQEQRREQQNKIAKANPVLIALKSEYLLKDTIPIRRHAILREFIELYRQSYKKQVPVDALMKEWDVERRQAFMQKLCAAATGGTKVNRCQ